jgi:hypothetical protein
MAEINNPKPPQPQPNRDFGNPYMASAGHVNLSSLQTNVGTNDYNYIKTLRPTQSTMTALVGTFFQRFCAECRARNLEDFTQQSEFEQFVASLKITTEDEYEQLKSDSTNYQRIIAARPELAGQSIGVGGLPNRATVGDDGGNGDETSASNVRTGVKTPRAGNTPNAAVGTDVQRKRSSGGKNQGGGN